MKVVSLLSGGIDSSTLLYWLKHYHEDVVALTILYGQKHLREVLSAQEIAKRCGVHHKILDLISLREILSSALTREDIAVPEVPETADYYDTLQSTIVPNRNMILLSIAAGYAVSLGFDAVAYAAHWSDRGVYPDCRDIFVSSIEHTIRLATDNPSFRVLAPFISLDKSEIIRIGANLGVPYDLTWSCYRGEEIHCGTCSSCRERKRAFAEAGIPDPTEYRR